jgi:hypothetical protein
MIIIIWMEKPFGVLLSLADEVVRAGFNRFRLSSCKFILSGASFDLLLLLFHPDPALRLDILITALFEGGAATQPANSITSAVPHNLTTSSQ